jgi:hypothetical protein
VSDRAGSRPPVTVHAARLVPGRPPSARLLLDIELENVEDSTRWALLPGRLPPDEGGVFAVETLRGAAPGPVVAARILGPGGRLAVRLAARSRVRLRDASIAWWGPPPGRIEVVIVLADVVVVGDRPLESWLAAEADGLPDRADVSLRAAATVSSRMTEGLVAVPLELRGVTVLGKAAASVEIAT